MEEKITISVIKADVGGITGHSMVHSDLLCVARKEIEEACHDRLIIDGFVTNVGDDLELIMTHRKGEENEEIHKFAWDVFKKATEKAKELKLYGAGQDLLKDAFSGNIKGMGPGVAEIEFIERKSDPIIIFMADKTSPGAWNYPLYKIFADPFNTAGLIIDSSMHDGFIFEILNVKDGKTIKLSCPEELYDLLMFIGATSKFLIKRVYRKKDNEIAAVSSTQKLNFIAGKYVGKDDPVMIVRCQSGFPAVGEVLEPFAFSYIVDGWMRGSHNGPIMPVSFRDAHPTRFDGPPRVIAAGFQISNGKLVGPQDMFDDPSFDEARRQSNIVANYLRAHGPFEPHRLSLDELEYTTMPGIMDRLKDRFE
ncbi:MAG: fructose-1,6-bisphosphate aldolase/phosphatase [Deferribacterota bacterium]|nr:fructose-1,6-bisphosphate aldolase/phosphatase [Deferribacterota bacterium]